MTPKKVKTIINKTSEDLNISESIIDDVISFYWKQVRNSIVEVKNDSLKINGLGTFNVKSWKLNGIIDKYEKNIKSLEKYNNKYMTFQRHAILANTKKRLEKLQALKEKINKEKLRKKEIKEKRKEYVNNKNLESKESDFRRNKK